MSTDNLVLLLLTAACAMLILVGVRLLTFPMEGARLPYRKMGLLVIGTTLAILVAGVVTLGGA